jgi:RNA polymerase sigma factor (sigma-70 family)
MPVQAELLLRQIHRLASRRDEQLDSDAELLGRFIELQDEPAFTALVTRHAPMVLGVCRRLLRDPHQAEDSAQAVLLILARKAGSVRPPDRLAAWLYGVARQVALNALRGKARRQRREKQAGQPTPFRDPLDELTGRELLAALDEEVQRLPAVLRQPVILCCLEGKTQEEVARQLGWTPGSVKGRLERGRSRLHARLVKRGLSLSAALAMVEVSRGAGRAAVPAILADTTVRASLAYAWTGKCLGGIGPLVAAQAEETLKGMTAAKTKLSLALLLVAGVLAAGAGLAYQALAAKEPGEQGTFQEPAQVQEAKAARDQSLDRYGDPLPPGSIGRLGTTRLRHGFMTYALAFSPDGKVLASSGAGRGVCLWDVATGKELYQLEATSAGYSVAFSPDGKILASAREIGNIQLWDPTTGRKLRDVPGSGNGVPMALAFSPDGTLLASGGHDKLVRLIDVASGRELRQLSGHEGSVLAVAFAPDGKTLASASLDKTVRLWDPATGEERARLTHKNLALRLAFFPDGKTLATMAEYEAVRLWDVASAKELRALEVPKSAGATNVAVSPDGRFVASGHRDGMVRIWDPTTGQELRHWRAHAFYYVSALAFAPDGKTLASGGHVDSSVRLWDPATGEERLPFGGPRNWIAGMHFTADGKSLELGSRDSAVRRWDWAADHERILDPGKAAYLNYTGFSADGRVRASANNQEHIIIVWDDPQSATGRVLDKFEGSIAALALSPDSKLLATGGDRREVHLYDLTASKKLRTIQADQMIASLAFSADGKTLASGAGTPSGGGLRSPTIRLWDVATGKAVRGLPHDGHVFDLLFSPDGRFLVSAGWFGDFGPRLWNLSTGKELPLPPARVECNALAFSPDSRLLAWGSGERDNSVHVLETATQQEVSNFRGHHSGIRPLAFTPDGRLLASGGGDSTVLLWDLTGRYRDGRFTPAQLSAPDLEKLWTALADSSPASAFQARQTLALAPAEQVVTFLRERLQPEAAADPRQVAACIADLDSREFAVREKAVKGLEQFGPEAEPALRRALAANPSLEARRRIEALLAELAPTAKQPLRKRRAIALLEQLGTPQAMKLLDRLAKSNPETIIGQEAKMSLERLAGRRTTP